jgi:hypothetical protein
MNRPLWLTYPVLTGALLGAIAAYAAPDGDYEIAIPRSQLNRDQGAEPVSVTTRTLWSEPRYGEGARIELSASSWVPTRLRVPTHLDDASGFTGSGVPQVSLTFLSSPVVRMGRFSTQLLAGAAFQMLTRKGTYSSNVTASVRPIEESLYLIPVRLGADAKLELHSLASLYSELAIVPVAGFTTRTLFDEGRTTLGIPLQVSLGLTHDLRWLSTSLQWMQLKAGADATASFLTDSDFSAVGAHAALSFPL